MAHGAASAGRLRAHDGNNRAGDLGQRRGAEAAAVAGRSLDGAGGPRGQAGAVRSDIEGRGRYARGSARRRVGAPESSKAFGTAPATGGAGRVLHAGSSQGEKGPGPD